MAFTVLLDPRKMHRKKKKEQKKGAKKDPAVGLEKRIQRHLERWMDPREEAAEGHTAAPGKRIAHARAGEDEDDGGEENAQKRIDGQTDAAGLASGRVHEDLQEGNARGRR